MGRLAVASLLLLAACSRYVPGPAARPDLPALTPDINAPEHLQVTLGPQGRLAMIGEYKLAPEGLGLDLGKIMGDNASLVSGALWCVEPSSWLGDALVLTVGVTWWPPGVEPKIPSRSITEGLMRCLGYLGQDAGPWNRATVYLRPGSIPQVIPFAKTPVLQEGTDTLVAAFEEAFLFGIAAPFQIRGLAWKVGTQDGSLEDSARGVHRAVEAHVKHQGSQWTASNRITYSAAPDADTLNMGGASIRTNIQGVSYILAQGVDQLLVPTEISRAVFRVKAGVGKTTVTMTTQARAKYSPGLSCVLRTLYPPALAPMMQPPQPVTDGGVPADADGGAPEPKIYPGVNLEEAQKCVLTDEDQQGVKRTIH